MTVGIAYQNVYQIETLNGMQNEQEGPHSSISGRPRRTFEGTMKTIRPIYTNLKLAKFSFGDSGKDACENSEVCYTLIKSKPLDFLWLTLSFNENMPLFNGFYSQFMDDTLPLTVIGYLDPISHPPTRNDVVHETLVRSLHVANETGMEYHPVTYDLAVALKAYSIQSLRAPEFDRLIILLGHFHIEMAFFGAVGTYLSDSGLEYLLTETNVLAEGSLNGFIKGKFYNRCTRIHQIAATALEKALFERFLDTHCLEDTETLLESLQTIYPCDTKGSHDICNREEYIKFHNAYEEFFHRVIKGEFGNTASYWAIYVYFINRLYRELQRAVKTNDVELYISVLHNVIETFFALNRPNYARWGSLFLHKLKTLDTRALEILKAGAFSIRRTQLPYSRSPIDLTLEQTINKDAASSAKGITSFSTSENAFRRWCINLTQRSMAVCELKDMTGLQSGETINKQLRQGRIEKDNKDIEALNVMIKST